MMLTVNLNDFKEAVEAIWLRGKYKSSTVSKVDVISNTAVAIFHRNQIQLLNGNDTCAVSVNIGYESTDSIEDEQMFIFDIEKIMKYIKNLKTDVIEIQIKDAHYNLITDETRVKLPKLLEHSNMGLISRIREFKIESNKPTTFGKTELKCLLRFQGADLAKAIKYCNLVGTAAFKIDYHSGKETFTVSSSNTQQTELVDRKVELLTASDNDLTVEFSAPIDKFCVDGPMFIFSDDDKPIILIGTDRKMVIAPYIRG